MGDGPKLLLVVFNGLKVFNNGGAELFEVLLQSLSLPERVEILGEVAELK